MACTEAAGLAPMLANTVILIMLKMSQRWPTTDAGEHRDNSSCWGWTQRWLGLPPTPANTVTSVLLGVSQRWSATDAGEHRDIHTVGGIAKRVSADAGEHRDIQLALGTDASAYPLGDM